MAFWAHGEKGYRVVYDAKRKSKRMENERQREWRDRYGGGGL